MTTALAMLGLVAVAALVFAAFMAARSHKRLNEYLQQHHPQVWAQIEEPYGVESSASSRRSRFISQRKFRELEDPDLVKLAEAERRAVHCVLALIFLVVLLAAAYSMPAGAS